MQRASLLFFLTAALTGLACGNAAQHDAPSTPKTSQVDAGGPDSGAESSSGPLGGIASPTIPVSTLPSTATIDIPAGVYTQHNDVSRTGANLFETELTVDNVQKETFGLLFSREIVGQAYAQPLFAPAVDIGGTQRDIVVVATEHDDVYAFDALDASASAPLWHVHLAEPVPTGDLLSVGYCNDLSPEIGITATPVIDPERALLYVETKEKSPAGAYVHHLHALDLTNGSERLGGPVEITAGVLGSGDGATDGLLSFDPLHENARAALLLSHGVLWLAYAGHCDAPPYHGWVFAYDALTLHQLGVYVDTTNAWAGGIWMGGQGMAGDEHGDAFFVSGNAPYDESTDPMSLGDSIGKLHLGADGLSLADWFTPFNQEFLGASDLDLGSTGVMLVPGTTWAIGAGKEGKLYVVDRNSMGHFHDGDDSQIVQSFQATAPLPQYTHALFGSPVFWNGRIYLWGQADDLRSYRLGDAGFDTTPQTSATLGIQPPLPGAILSISANGNTPRTGILWASHPKSDAGRATAVGVLRAFDAADVTHELWNSDQVAARDAVGNFAKFSPPTVVDGRVYLATFSGKLQVYGLLSGL